MKIAGFELVVTPAVPPDGIYLQRGRTEIAFDGRCITERRYVRKVLDLAARTQGAEPREER